MKDICACGIFFFFFFFFFLACIGIQRHSQLEIHLLINKLTDFYLMPISTPEFRQFHIYKATGATIHGAKQGAVQ